MVMPTIIALKSSRVQDAWRELVFAYEAENEELREALANQHRTLPVGVSTITTDPGLLEQEQPENG